MILQAISCMDPTAAVAALLAQVLRDGSCCKPDGAMSYLPAEAEAALGQIIGRADNASGCVCVRALVMGAHLSEPPALHVIVHLMRLFTPLLANRNDWVTKTELHPLNKALAIAGGKQARWHACTWADTRHSHVATCILLTNCASVINFNAYASPWWPLLNCACHSCSLGSFL